MRLDDFERTDDGDYARFVTRVPDVAGVEDFEFRIAGPARLAEIKRRYDPANVFHLNQNIEPASATG